MCPIGFLFTEDFSMDAEAVEKSLKKPGAAARLTALLEAFATVTDWAHASLETTLKATATALGIKTGEMVHPARVALSGRSVGPGLYEMIEVLGKDRTLARLERAKSLAAE
jgi:glutamyl/glutaminyl-tRNA synthetase